MCISTSITLLLYLGVSWACMSVCDSRETWPIRQLEMINADATLVSDAAGADVIDATLDMLDTSCIFASDRLVQRRYAQAISNDGLGPYNNTGGVWQASERMIVSTKRIAELTPMGAAIFNQFGIDWLTVTSLDLRKPLYSALAFRFYLHTLPSCSVPRTYANQAAFLIEEVPTSVPVYAPSFVSNLATDGEKACSLLADIVFILDGSVDLFSLKLFLKNFTSEFTWSSGKMKIAIVQFTDTTRIELSLKTYSKERELFDAIEGIQPLGLSENATVDIPSALSAAANLFTTEAIETRTYRRKREACRIAILLTHGQTNDTMGTTSATETLQVKNVAVFAIGIGGGVDFTYLQLIGSDCSHVAHLSNVAELDEILPEMKTLVCKESMVLEFVSPMRQTLKPGEKIYVKFNVEAKKGFKIDLSTLIGEVLVYMSTKLKHPNSVVHQWKCRADMTQRGSCYIPPAQFIPLNTSIEVVLYATYTTNANEGTIFYTIVSGTGRDKLSPLVLLLTFCAMCICKLQVP